MRKMPLSGNYLRFTINNVRGHCGVYSEMEMVELYLPIQQINTLII